MKTKTTIYALEIKLLLEATIEDENIKNATPLLSLESSTAFGGFQVGDGISDGPNIHYLGVIQHIHHIIGDYDDDKILHTTTLYVYDDTAH
jgi:hypothetical protein